MARPQAVARRRRIIGDNGEGPPGPTRRRTPSPTSREELIRRAIEKMYAEDLVYRQRLPSRSAGARRNTGATHRVGRSVYAA